MNTHDDTFEINDDTLHVHYDPINGADTFAGLLNKLSEDSDSKDLYVIFDEGVGVISSVYVGVLLATALRLQNNNRQLHVRCTSALQKVMRYIGGQTLLDFTETWRT